MERSVESPFCMGTMKVMFCILQLSCVLQIAATTVSVAAAIVFDVDIVEEQKYCITESIVERVHFTDKQTHAIQPKSKKKKYKLGTTYRIKWINVYECVSQRNFYITNIEAEIASESRTSYYCLKNFSHCVWSKKINKNIHWMKLSLRVSTWKC